MNAPEGCRHGTHTNATAYIRGTYSRVPHTNTHKHKQTHNAARQIKLYVKATAGTVRERSTGLPGKTRLLLLPQTQTDRHQRGLGEDSARTRRTRRGFGEDPEDSARIRRGPGGLGEDSEDSDARIRRGLGGLGEDSARTRRTRRGFGEDPEDSARIRRTRTRGFGEDSEDSARIRRGHRARGPTHRGIPDCAVSSIPIHASCRLVYEKPRFCLGLSLSLPQRIFKRCRVSPALLCSNQS